MRIESVTIEDFRVIEHVELDLSPGVNLIWGDNGAGKTSILEAVFVAARGRSFRHQEAGPFIRTGTDQSRIVTHLLDDGGRTHVLGVERGSTEQRVRLDGQDLNRRSEQVRALPLLLLTPNSHALIEGPPELRRRYLDLGMFHVEQHYQRWYSDYHRALRQRNAALRHQSAAATSWDGVLCEAAQALGDARHRYVDELAIACADVLADIAPDVQVQIKLRSGWDDASSLVDQLTQRLEVDRRQGFTGVGPHRADIVIRAAQSAAAKRLSRGQQKLVILALTLGQARVLERHTGIRPVLLLDDLPAELDRGHRDRVMGFVEQWAGQALISAVEPDSLGLPSNARVFHVEQGGRLAG